MALLRNIVRYGNRRDVFSYNEWDVVIPLPLKIPLAIMSENDIRKLIVFCREGFSCKNIGILIPLFTGLRIGEVSALQWADIDIKNGTVRITKTVERICCVQGTKIIIGTPKTTGSCRDVPLSRSLLSFLRPFSKVFDPSFYIVSGSGKVMEPRLLRLHFYRVLKDLGIDRVGFHCLRHTFASRLVSSGCDVKTVSVLLGHASVKTTLDHYVHPDIERKRKAIEKLGKVLD